jgi:Kef-type K+ transport system membrane component KefB/nucleotide-binding universal stress UspA family protein
VTHAGGSIRRISGWLAASAVATVLLLMSAPLALAAEGGSGPSEAVFVAQLMVLLLVGRLLGEALLRMGQPAIMGQLMAGLLLGPSLLGALFPDLQHAIFPPSKEQKAMLDAVAQFGVLLILLMTGMETDLALVKRSSRASIAASVSGVIIPFALGFALGESLPDAMIPDPSKRLITSLFLGTALSIASVKIVATVVREMNFLRRTVGQVIIGSAIVDDTIGWIIIAVIFGLALKGHVDPFSIAQSVIGTIAFMVFSLTIGRRIVSFIIRWVNDTFVSELAVITAILLIMGAMALTTSLIGVHTVLGAFVAGILIGESPLLTRHIEDELRGLIVAFFMPVFFGTAALSADLTVLKDPNLLLLTCGLILIATVGKFSGAFLGGELGGLSRREALALATGMNARGSTEVIVATIGLSMGALSQNLFTMIVTMAILTTLAMPPTLRWALSRVPMRKEEKERLEREEQETKGFVPNMERLLVAIDDSANGKFAARIAGMVAGTTAMPTTVMHVTPGKKTGGKKANDKAPSSDEKEAAQQAAESAAQLLREAARQIANDETEDGEKKEAEKLDVTVLTNKTTEAEVVAEEAEKGYDMMVIGLQNTTRGHKFNTDVTQLAAGFEGPLTIVEARDGHIKNPAQAGLSILVPVNGTGPSRRAAEVAISMARATRAPVTALYVAPPKQNGAKARTKQMGDAVLKDIVKLGETYDVEAAAALRAEKDAGDAILKEAAKRRHNLIVIGVERRPGKELFLGETATAVLEKSDRSIVFVVS